MTLGGAALVRKFGAADACAARLLCDDHSADDVAFTVVEPDLTARELTYGELSRESARFAAALADLGVGPGDRVAVLMGRSIEHIVTLLGIWRRGAVLGSDRALDGWIVGCLTTAQHLCGTAAMGPDAVVDLQLRVHGLERLRVVDLSVLPVAPRRGTAATAVTIGEAGAEFLDTRPAGAAG